MDVIIVCHTEFGFVNDKKNVIADKNRHEGVGDGVKNLIKIADKYGAKVTFAVMPEVVDFFSKSTNHEIGLHIHPGWEKWRQDDFEWYVGDFYLRKKCQQLSSSSVLKDYSYEEQLGMIRVGKEYLERTLGITPKVFVAGRWSLNNDIVKALIETGFTHDCSASAHAKAVHFDWSELPRICMPYHPDKNDYQKRGDLPLLIVPISQYFPRGNVNPEIVPIVGLSWLRACFLEYYKQEVPLFHICLHSPSMTDNYFISAMDNFLRFISKHKNINFKFASEIQEYPQRNFKTNISPYLFGINKEIFKSGLKKLIRF